MKKQMEEAHSLTTVGELKPAEIATSLKQNVKVKKLNVDLAV